MLHFVHVITHFFLFFDKTVFLDWALYAKTFFTVTVSNYKYILSKFTFYSTLYNYTVLFLYIYSTF